MMMAPAMIHTKDGGATHPIGTGPFVFDSWTPGSTFVVSRNPNYWQKGLPHLDQITFKVITDEPTAVAALRTGDINMFLSINAQDADRLSSSYTVVKDWDSETVSVLANTATNINGVTNPLSNIHARRALAYATDRDALARHIGKGVETASSPFAPSNVWGLPDSQNGYVGYDPAKARKELAAYTTDTGQKTLSFTLAAVADVDTERNVQVLQDQWKKVGIDAHIQTSDEPSLIRQLVASEFQGVVLSNYNYPDPDTSRVFWVSSTAKGVGQININFSLYTDPQIDKDLNTGRVDGFPNQRKAAYDDLVHRVNAAMTNIWLYRTPYSFIASHRLQGLDTARTVAFGNFEPKTWLGDLWLSDN
jgi:peptide/nickel transport system substrate-binding protein